MEYKRLTNEELNDFTSRVVVQLEPTLTQQVISLILELSEYRTKIENGTLVDCIWFISWINETVCRGQVIGYEEDSGFVILTNGSMISADKIWTNCEDAEKELLKRKIKQLDKEEYQEFKSEAEKNLKS